MKPYKRVMWGGFVDGKLDQQFIDDKFGGQYYRAGLAIFFKREEARKQYQDVRKIRIEEVHQ